MSDDSLDEINQIMNDIEKLQSKGDASAKAEVAQDTAPAPESTVSLSEFSAGGGDGGSMEETLGDLEEEHPTTGGGLLSAAPHPEETHPETLEEEYSKAEEASASTQVSAPVVPISTYKPAERPKMSNTSNGPGTLSMTLRGDMQLELNYESGEQAVSLKFDDGTFIVQLADGTEFRVPMKPAKSIRRTG